MRNKYKTERVNHMKKKRAGENSIQARHDKRRQKRIREQKIRRYTFFTVLAAIAIMAVMFFTPFFNIKTVQINGLTRLSNETITEQIGNITGKNLFRTQKRSLKNKLYKLAYVDKVNIKKKPFPPTVIINIEECVPICQIESANQFVTIDKDGKVLGKHPEKQEGIAVMEGVNLVSANEGELIAFKDEETQKIIMSCIGYMQKADIIKDITVLSFADMTNITFNYQNRLDAICGTHIDFQRKLALFKEAVNSNKLTENSRGTINLSTTGKAIYTP